MYLLIYFIQNVYSKNYAAPPARPALYHHQQPA